MPKVHIVNDRFTELLALLNSEHDDLVRVQMELSVMRKNLSDTDKKSLEMSESLEASKIEKFNLNEQLSCATHAFEEESKKLADAEQRKNKELSGVQEQLETVLAAKKTVSAEFMQIATEERKKLDDAEQRILTSNKIISDLENERVIKNKELSAVKQELSGVETSNKALEDRNAKLEHRLGPPTNMDDSLFDSV